MEYPDFPLMANPQWQSEVFDGALEGVSSAISPDRLGPNQLAWGYNLTVRGGKPKTRPVFKYLGPLPDGLVQGVSYFSVQGGMGVASIAGQLYRLRLDAGTFSYQTIPQAVLNSSIVKQVWMVQTVETLVIQDFQSNPLLYDGANTLRSEPSNPTRPGVPRGKQMAYGNGRLWVAIDDNNLVAGDIRTDVAGSELLFTETQYLSGGGALFFPKGMTALGFISVTGTSDYGALAVLGNGFVDSVRADISSRDLWSTYPGFVTTVLRQSGCAGQASLTSVNQDLYWRDNEGGIRSIRSSLSDESGAGNSPISREVSRLTDFDSKQLLSFCPAITFDNRLLMGSSPFLNDVGGVSWKALIALDFAPLSVMSGKIAPAYDGQWAGLNITHMFEGKIGGKSRAFAISHNEDSSNSLWEIMPQESGNIADQAHSCAGSASSISPYPITAYLETPRRNFGDAKRRKRLERCDIYLSDAEGQVELNAYWRCDNSQKWQQWDEVRICAKVTDPNGDSPSDVHIWKNLVSQQRAQIKSFTIPNAIDPISKFGLQTGFEFQLRVSWTGKAKIYKIVLYSSFLDDTPYANRNLVTDMCLDNDITGNTIDYVIPPCYDFCYLFDTLIFTPIWNLLQGQTPMVPVPINGSLALLSIRIRPRMTAIRFPSLFGGPLAAF